MNLQQLTTFCTVLNEGSMTAAAEKLFLTQPAVSQQIRNLETELGVELLVRGVRQVKPTFQGQLLYDYAKKIIFLTKQAEVAIQTMSSEIKGHICIGTLNSIGMSLMSPVVGLFLKNNSQLRVKLVYLGPTEILKGMQNNELDVVVMPDIRAEYGADPAGYNESFLLKDEMLLVASGRDTSVPQRILASELANRPMVLLAERYPRFDAVLGQSVAAWANGIQPVFEGTNVGTIKRVIESGLGWGFLPGHSIKKQLRMERLTAIEVEDFSYTFDLNYYWKTDHISEAAAQVLFRALQQQIRV